MEVIWERMRGVVDLHRLSFKPRHRRRLLTDFTALIAGLRPVVMVDYLPLNPHLLEMMSNIVSQINMAQLRVMHLEDCIYVFHRKNLEKYMETTLSSCPWLHFVVPDNPAPRMASADETTEILARFKHVETNLLRLWSREWDGISMDIVQYIRDAGVTVPTLNGWLLAYPVIYLFNENRVLAARQCLSSEDLHLYQLTIQRRGSKPAGVEDDILSFTVPLELSKLGCSEPWAKSFLSFMQTQAETSGTTLQLQVTKKTLQLVAF